MFHSAPTHHSRIRALLLVLVTAAAVLVAVSPGAAKDPPNAKRCWPEDRYGHNDEIPDAIKHPERFASCGDCEPYTDQAKCDLWFGGQTPGNEKGSVDHSGWPGITGIRWQVIVDSNDGEYREGTRFNDELLGRNGSDTFIGKGGHDVIWGDSNIKLNGPKQKDKLVGGAGNDWIYSSHGKNTITGGKGNDKITAYYGRGTVDCGPGQDRVHIRGSKSKYKLKRCEKITLPH